MGNTEVLNPSNSFDKRFDNLTGPNQSILTELLQKDPTAFREFHARSAATEFQQGSITGAELAAEVTSVAERIALKAASEKTLTTYLEESALILVGGTASRTMGFLSDFDAMIITKDRLEKTSWIGEFQMGLDSGLRQAKIQWNPAARSLVDARRIGAHTFDISQDLARFETMSAVLHSRLLAGSKEVFEAFQANVHKAVKEQVGNFFEFLDQQAEKRLVENDYTTRIAEPNIKLVPGGLRTLGSMFDARKGFELAGMSHSDLGLSTSEWAELDSAQSYLLGLKNVLHLRPEAGSIVSDSANKLCLAEVCEVMRHMPNENDPLEDQGVSARAELYDTINRVNKIHAKVRFPSTSRVFFQSESDIPVRSSDSTYSKLEETTVNDSPEQIVSSILNFFTSLQTRFIDAEKIGPRLTLPAQDRAAVVKVRELVSALSPSEIATDPNIAEVRKIFSVCGHVAGTVRQIRESGFLEKLFPTHHVVKHLTELTFHKFTLDEHAIRAMESADQILLRQDSRLEKYEDQIRSIRRTDLLQLGIYFHDHGSKMDRRDHLHCQYGGEIAQESLQNIGYSIEDAEIVGKLVEHHLDMFKLSQRPDHTDPEAITNLAKIVENKEFLNMLFVLTFADKESSNPQLWTRTKIDWLCEVYESTMKELGVEIFDSSSESMIAAASALSETSNFQQVVESKVDESRISDILDSMPSEYLSLLSARPRPELLLAHTIGVEKVIESRHSADPCKGFATILNREDLPNGPTSEHTNSASIRIDIAITAEDRKGLIRQITRQLANQNFDIVAAEFNTRKDGIACDLISVRSPNNVPYSYEYDALEKMLTKLIEDPNSLQNSHSNNSTQNREAQSISTESTASVGVTPIEASGGVLLEVHSPNRGVGFAADLFDIIDEAGAAAGLQLMHRRVKLGGNRELLNSIEFATASGKEVPEEVYESIRQEVKKLLSSY